MSRILFRLRNVPDDEAEEVRQLLAEHEIEIYETSAGNWGISMPAIWVMDESRFGEARTLLETYQRERTQRIRKEYEALRSEGREESIGSSFRANPLRFIAYGSLIAAVLYLSVSSFFRFQ